MRYKKEKQPPELYKQDYSTSASQVADGANIRIIPETAIEKLKILCEHYKDVTTVKGFLQTGIYEEKTGVAFKNVSPI